MLAEAAELRGDFDRARYLLDDNKQLASDRGVRIKRMALATFLEPTPSSLASEAEDFLKQFSNASNYELQTAATAYARAGKPNEALRALHDCIEARGVVDHSDWAVVGLLAEHHGLIDLARDAYAKVEAPENPYKTSPHELAQRRLAKLPAAGAEPE